MALTYLTLVNDVLTKLNEVNLTSSTFPTANGFHADAQNAVNFAINDINSVDWEWPFNKANGSQALTIGQQEYSLAATTNSVDWDSFYIQGSATAPIIGTTNLPYIDYDKWIQFRRVRDLNMVVNGTYTVPDAVYRPQSDLKFAVSGPPAAAYTVKYDYWIKPVALSLYTDTTTIPANYQQVIFKGAMAYAYDFRDNIEASAKVSKEFRDSIDNMRRILVPQTRIMRTSQIIQGYGINPYRFNY